MLMISVEIRAIRECTSVYGKINWKRDGWEMLLSCRSRMVGLMDASMNNLKSLLSNNWQRVMLAVTSMRLYEKCLRRVFIFQNLSSSTRRLSMACWI
jgi:hypothetical protein